MNANQKSNNSHPTHNQNHVSKLGFLKKSLWAIPFLMLSACSALEWSESKLYEQGQDAFDHKNYTDAAKHFQAFEGRFPLSLMAKQALFNTAYAQYKNKDKDLAAQTIQRFIELYPNHAQVDYAYYLRGLIQFNDDLGMLGRFAEEAYDERDPQSMKLSYAAFKALVDRFPNSKYAIDSLERMRFIVNALARHETKIARYYFERGAFLAASQRAEMVVQNYDRAPAIEEALGIMAKSYEKLGLGTQAKAARDLLAANFKTKK
jgi:outer membrane protein assembly factor BamD